MAAAPTYRAVEKDVADAESKLQKRYGQGISATYVCSTCSRFAHEHPDCNVKDCNESVLIPEEYETRLVGQLQDLQNVLDERERANALAKALDDQKEDGDARLVKLGAFLQKKRRIERRLEVALQERKTAASTDAEFLAAVTAATKALKELDISKMLSPSDDDDDVVAPPRAPDIATPASPATIAIKSALRHPSAFPPCSENSLARR